MRLQLSEITFNTEFFFFHLDLSYVMLTYALNAQCDP